MLEVSLFSRNQIKDLHDQDGLHQDRHHMKQRKQTSENRRVDPLVAIVCTAQKVDIVCDAIS